MTSEIDLQPEQIHRWAYVYAYAHMYTQGNKKNLLFLRIVEKLLKTRGSPYLHWLKPNVLPLPGYLKLGRNTTPGMTLHYSHAHTCLPKHSHNKRLQLKLKHKPLNSNSAYFYPPHPDKDLRVLPICTEVYLTWTSIKWEGYQPAPQPGCTQPSCHLLANAPWALP